MARPMARPVRRFRPLSLWTLVSLSAWVCVWFVLGPRPAVAQAEGWVLDGEFELGVRSVDVDGAVRKYREDLNYDDGPRLFGLRLRLSPESAAGAVDRLELSASNLGGDPFETLRLEVAKTDVFELSYERRESEYFYDDVILPPALASLEGSTGGDFHTFDFERGRDRARLRLEVTPNSTLRLGFDGYRKRGESTTTLDVQRDEFELDRPIDETSNDYLLGFEHRWQRATLILEERVRDYENRVEIFLPGASPGENTDDPATLSFFFLDQPYDYTSYDHTARLLLRPTDRWDVRARATVGSLDLDVDAAETSAGTTFTGAPFDTDRTGSGAIERDTELFDLETVFRVSERWAVTGAIRRHELDQRGSFLFGPIAAAPGTADRSRWEIERTGLEAGFEVRLAAAWTAAAGVVREDRDVVEDTVGGGETFASDESTERSGWYATLGWRPSARLRLNLSVEDNSFDDPYTLASPTDRRRVRLQGRYRWQGGWTLSGTYSLREVDNDDSGWSADTDHFDLRLALERERYDLSVGASRLDLTRAIDQLVRGGGREEVFDIDYRAEADLFDARGRFRLSERWTVGGSAQLYDNAGSFGLDRQDLRLFVEVPVAEYRLRVGGRRVSYDEDRFDFDDYDADLLEVGVGYSF